MLMMLAWLMKRASSAVDFCGKVPFSLFIGIQLFVFKRIIQRLLKIDPQYAYLKDSKFFCILHRLV